MISQVVEPRQKAIHQPPSSFSLLPDEITENILARVSRCNYPSLYHVSKRFRSLVSSMQIYKTRSEIGAQETCFYVCLKFRNQPYPSWFSLTLTKGEGTTTGFNKDSSGNSVVPTPFPSSHSPHITNQTTKIIGSEIYIIGGPYKEPSSSVRILDCRSHTWRDAPSMTVARKNACALVCDDEIYVMGGCDIDKYSANWIEVFDMKSQSWTALPGPGADEEELRNLVRGRCGYNIVDVFERKLHIAVDGKEYAYEPKDGKWKFVRQQSSIPFTSLEVLCIIENVLYGCSCTRSGVLMWSECKSDTDVREWREIKGLGELRKNSTMGLLTASHFRMGYHGGKLLVMWKLSGEKQKHKIWCALISLESRCNGREVWGNVECVDKLTFPVESYESFRLLTVSV